MSSTIPQTSWDSRGFSERLRRIQLWAACDHFNINYAPGAPATACRELLKANGIDDGQLMQWFEGHGKIRVVEGKDEHGVQHREFYPIAEPHESARVQSSGQAIDYERLLAERTAEKEAADAVVEDQAELVRQLMERVTQMEANQLPLQSMSPPQLKKSRSNEALMSAASRKRTNC